MKRFIIILSLFVLTSTPGFAANPFVRCVQNQLVTLDFDPGPVDGLLGRKTRTALQNFLQKPEVNTSATNGIAVATNTVGIDKTIHLEIPPLSKKSAVTWCRIIGKLSHETRKQMPSAKPSVILADETPNNLLRNALKDQLSDIKLYLNVESDVWLASRIDLVTARNASDAVKRLRNLQRDNAQVLSSKKEIRRRCADKAEPQGFANRDQIVLCFPKDSKFNISWRATSKYFLAYALSHEYFHHVQREFAAGKNPQYYRKGHRKPRQYLWPSWMTEGSADVFARQYLKDRFQLDWPLYKSYARAAKSKRTLSQLAKLPSLSASEDYFVAEFAVDLLARRYGEGAILDYWEKVGLRKNAETAFEEVFGLTLKQFEKEFQTVRKDFKLSQKFANVI